MSLTVMMKAPRYRGAPSIRPRVVSSTRAVPSRAGRVGANPSEDHSLTARLPRKLEGLKIVVVDDDESSLAYFATALRLCGAEVEMAGSAADGLRLVRERKPDAVVSDIAMPGKDGYWLVGAIRRREHGSAQHIPVIATTAFSREHSRERALDAGFTESLMKPVAPEELCRVVARAVGR